MGKLAKDSVITSIIIVFGFLLGIVLGMFVYPKLFNKEELGIFRYLVGWGTVFAQFCAFGIGSATVRSYYRLKDQKSHGELSALLLIIPLCALLIFVLTLVPFADLFLKKTLNGLPFEGWAIIVSLILITLALTYLKTYQSIAIIQKKTSVLFFVTEVFNKLGVLAVFLLYYFDQLTASGLLLGLGAVYLFQLGIILYNIRSYFSAYPFKKPESKFVKPMLSLSLICLFDTSAALLVAQIDIMMIGVLCSNSLAKMQEYGMALSVATVVYLPWRSINSTTVPFIAEAFSKNDMHSVNKIYQKSSLNLVLIGSIIFILIYSSIDNVIKLIPDDYSVIKWPVLFIGVSKLIDMLGSVNGNIIVLSPFYKYNLYYGVITVVMLFGLNLLFIPVWGITGSAIATVVALLFLNVMRGWLLFSKYGIHPFHLKTPEVLIVLSAVFILGVFFPDLHHSAFISLVIRSFVLTVVISIYILLRKPSEDVEKIRITVFKRVPLIKRWVK